MKKLEFQDIIMKGLNIGLKNLVPMIVNIVLWLVTIWVPYINVGTTICIISGLPLKLSRGEKLSMTEIFDPIYRRRMGEMFLTYSLVGTAVGFGMVFVIVPGIVIAMAFLLAPLLVLDKGVNPLEAIKQSNDLTYGNKLVIGAAMVVVSIAFGIVSTLLGMIPFIGIIFMILLFIIQQPIMIGINAYVYGSLTGQENIDDIASGEGIDIASGKFGDMGMSDTNKDNNDENNNNNDQQ